MTVERFTVDFDCNPGEYRINGEVVSGKFSRKKITIAGISGQNVAARSLRRAVVVSPGSIEIVDAAADGIVEHRGGSLFVDLAVIAAEDGQAHGAEPQGGNL